MIKARLPLLWTVVVGLAGALCGALATPAAAQQEACVFLQAGAGYAATMSVTFAGATIGPSGTFDVGQTRCLPLTAVGDGVPFSVQVHAILGQTGTCTPSDITRNAGSNVNVTYFATGTTLNVHCFMPSGPQAED